MQNTVGVKIELSIFGELFNPKELTEKIAVLPTSFGVKGDQISPQTIKGKVRKKKETSWEFSTGLIETFDFEDAFSIIKTNFQTKEDIISSFVKEYDLAVKLFVIIKAGNDTAPGIYMDKEVLSFITQIGAEIDIDIYV